MQTLTRAIDNNSKNYSKLNSLYSQQLSNLNSQSTETKSLRNAKVSEAQSVLRQLSKYGFNVNEKKLSISNLDRAKKLKGDKASEAESLLSTWHSLVAEVGNLNQELQEIEDEKRQVKINKELNGYQKTLNKISKTIEKFDRRNSVNDTLLSLIDPKDYDLQNYAITKSIQNQEESAKQLINEFNALAIKTVNFSENGEELYATMENLRNKILENAEAVYEYIKVLNDNEIARASEDVDEFANALDRLDSHLDNTRTNVSEGLLSGTSINDLQSSKNSMINLVDNNKLDKYANDVISMMNTLDSALNNYAIKNVDRTAKVANKNLQINKNMYNTLLGYASTYNGNKKIGSTTSISGKLDTTSKTETAYKLDTDLTSIYAYVYKEQKALTDKYSKDLSSKNYKTRMEAEYNYQMDSLDLQKYIEEQKIKASQKTINEYNRQLKDKSLTQSQKAEINDLIKAEQDAIIESQNNIKAVVNETYELQLGKLDEMVSKYDEYIGKLELAKALYETVKPNDLAGQLSILQDINKQQYNKKKLISENINKVKQEMSQLEKGSYEWNILNAKLSEYNDQWQDTIASIAEANNEIRDLKLDNTINGFELVMFGGKTFDDVKKMKELWLDGIEKQIALDDMYALINELGTTEFDERMALLEKQEKISKLEADYLTKQIEIYKLQQELENSREQRTVKTLQQNEDGTFQWNYVADKNEDELNKRLRQAEADAQNMQLEAKGSYIDELRNVAQKIKDGRYKNADELKADLDNLRGAYSIILNDDVMKDVDSMTNGLVEAFTTGNMANNALLTELTSTPVTKSVDGLKTSMVAELQSLGDKITKAIKNSLSGAKTASGLKSNNVSTKTTANSINIEKLEFPNATSSDEIRNALINLPQYAMQYANSKK